MRTELDRIREVEAISEGLAARNETRRQDIARAGFDEVFGLGGRLANLVRCEICGLLDDQSPCGDHATKQKDGKPIVWVNCNGHGGYEN